jgi:hypothetical protein
LSPRCTNPAGGQASSRLGWRKEIYVRRSGRLLGAQIVGHWQAQVAKRIDVFATALFHEMGVHDLMDLDLSYTPPLAAPWDAVQEAAAAWMGRAYAVAWASVCAARVPDRSPRYRLTVVSIVIES